MSNMGIFWGVTRALSSKLPAPRLVRGTSPQSQHSNDSRGMIQTIDKALPLLAPKREPLDWSLFKSHQKYTSGVPFSLEDRTVLAGITRCGKTTTARHLTAKYASSYPGLRIHIFDPKDRGDYDGVVRGVPVYHVRSTVAPDLLHAPGVLIWHAKGAAWGELQRWFERISNDPEPSLTVVDETARLLKRLGDPNSFPPSFITLLKEGGGEYHSMIILLQELAGSARQILGQSTHLLRFRLTNSYDERVADYRIARARASGRITTKEPRNWHGFYASRVDQLDQAREFSSWQSFI